MSWLQSKIVVHKKVIASWVHQAKAEVIKHGKRARYGGKLILVNRVYNELIGVHNKHATIFIY